MKSLDELRKNINKIDKQLIQLFEERMTIVSKIAEIKGGTGKKVYDSSREQEVIRRAIDNLNNKELTVYAKEYFEDLMKVSRKFQEKLIPIQKETYKVNIDNDTKVGYQGASGSYSEAAAMALWGQDCKRINIESFEGVFKAVACGDINQGIIPLENSSTGGLNDVFDLLREYNLYITGEIKIKIDHCLLGVKSAKFTDIKYVYSHPQAIRQCNSLFKKNPQIKAIEHSNTALAARDIAQWGKKDSGAIASKRSADIYNLDIIDENIQDCGTNSTRFIAIGREMYKGDSINKTSILFTTNHIPGALYKILKPFYDNGINISKIESRPNTNRSFEYYFYLDIDESLHSDKVKSTLDEVKSNCGYFRILGTYKSSGGMS